MGQALGTGKKRRSVGLVLVESLVAVLKVLGLGQE